MIAVVVSVIVVLGAFCVVLYLSQERRQRAHDEAVAKLVAQITKSNPANATLKAMTQTADVLGETVDKVTKALGQSFQTATGTGQSEVIPPAEEAEAMFASYIPDVDMDPYFGELTPPTENGMISSYPSEPTL